MLVALHTLTKSIYEKNKNIKIEIKHSKISENEMIKDSYFEYIKMF
jgi:hypothetical protein